MTRNPGNALLHFLSGKAVNGLTRSVAGLLHRPPASEVVDLVFVTPPKGAQGWILDAICREIGGRLPGLSIRYCPFGSSMPAARCYFYSHYMYYVRSLRSLQPTRLGRSYVFATHLESSKHGITDALLARALDNCDGVICMNSALRDDLQRLGVSRDRLSVLVGAASRDEFKPHARTADGKVGFCSAYYARKSPDLILEIVRALPHRQFLMLGKGWRDYPRFGELQSLANFEYLETSYQHYAECYARMSVFVSASNLEGGPIPLLEAMLSNAVPVASRTGFAPDVIQHGSNGFIFDLDAGADLICALIEQAFSLECDVSATAQQFDWRPYSERMTALMDLPSGASAATTN